MDRKWVVGGAAASIASGLVLAGVACSPGVGLGRLRERDDRSSAANGSGSLPRRLAVGDVDLIPRDPIREPRGEGFDLLDALFPLGRLTAGARAPLRSGAPLRDRAAFAGADIEPSWGLLAAVRSMSGVPVGEAVDAGESGAPREAASAEAIAGPGYGDVSLCLEPNLEQIVCGARYLRRDCGQSLCLFSSEAILALRRVQSYSLADLGLAGEQAAVDLGGDSRWGIDHGALAARVRLRLLDASPGTPCLHAPVLRNPDFRLDERIARIPVWDQLHFRGRGMVGGVPGDIVGDDPGQPTPSGLWTSDHAGVVATLRLSATRGAAPR